MDDFLPDKKSFSLVWKQKSNNNSLPWRGVYLFLVNLAADSEGCQNGEWVNVYI